MRKTLIILTTLLSLFLMSCSTNSTSAKAVEEGKIALVSKEYDKAKDLFTLAINESSKNTDAKSLLDLTTNYIELLSIIDSSEFDKAIDLILKIESNDKLDIIKDNFNEIKNSVIEKKEIFDKCIIEVESIETLLTENKIDDAKSQATAKLEEVKGIKSLEDRLNTVITNVDGIIANAKETILKYYDGSYGIEYENMEFFNNSKITELNGKAILNFIEAQDYGSPYEYIYRIEDNEVFRLDQGQYYWVSNSNKLIYRPKEMEEAYSQLEELEKENSPIISNEKAKELVIQYFLNTHSNYTINDIEVGVSKIIENNEYSATVTQNSGNYKAVAEYYINATTGEVRVFWD